MVGKTLSHYEITDSLGAGGMGEVYRARDTKLERDVAIKVLPDDLAADPDRLARFEREAKLLAALSHSNIGAIHGLEESDGVRFLVLELIEGESLERRLTRGAIPVSEALDIARQIAEALEAAHDAGIIHRDVKPANVLLTPNGSVKVLDFGIAKSTRLEDNAPLTEKATNLTIDGTLMGTPPYMAPEQIRGEAADKRADIWAFGCLVYEMLVGRGPFARETVADTLAAIVGQEPDWRPLPATTPTAAQRALRRCLAKSRRDRVRDIADVRLEIDEALARPGGEDFGGAAAALTAADQQSKRSAPFGLVGALVTVAALATVAALVLGALWLQTPEVDRSGLDRQRLETALLPPDGTTFDGDGGMALSPDGGSLAFVVGGEAGLRELWIRALDSAAATRLEGTAGARYPFWSPDGRNLGFFAEGSLKRVAATGGPVQTIAVATNARGGTWCVGDRIVYAPDLARGLAVVPAGGGEPTVLTTLDAEQGEMQHRLPSCLPTGDHALMLAQTAEGGSREDDSHIDVVSLATGERKEIIRANSSMAYSPSGHLLFWRAGGLMSVPFDVTTQEVAGEAVLVASEVAFTDNEYAVFSISETGLLAYQANDLAAAQSRMVGVDSAGEPVGEPSPAEIHRSPVVSHDGTRVAYEAADFSSLWVRDLVRGTTSRLTHQDGDHFSAVWSPDDEWILFGTDREGVWQVYRRHSSGSGSEELLLENDARIDPVDISPDGTYLAAQVLEPGADEHIALYSFDDRTLEVLIDTPFVENQPRFSPDGRWLAYTSSETGRFEVYVVPLPGHVGSEGGKYQASTDGGQLPAWDPSSEHLFYVSPTRQLMSVELGRQERLTLGVPQQLFVLPDTPPADYPYGVLPDGGTFLVNRLEESQRPDHLVLVQNWMSRLLIDR